MQKSEIFGHAKKSGNNHKVLSVNRCNRLNRWPAKRDNHWPVRMHGRASSKPILTPIENITYFFSLLTQPFCAPLRLCVSPPRSSAFYLLTQRRKGRERSDVILWRLWINWDLTCQVIPSRSVLFYVGNTCLMGYQFSPEKWRKMKNNVGVNKC